MGGVNVPQIVSGTAPQTIDLIGPKREFLLENLDATQNLTVTWNGAGGTWTLRPGRAMGLYVVGGMRQLVLTGTAQFQTLFYD